ncbi:UNVERIFIED_CONTAM: hypothetical protein RMT77_008895 [Armadillidium vulgare]
MNNQNFRICHVMLFFKKFENAAKICKTICEVYGDDAVGESTVWRWFAKFKAWKLSFEDDGRSKTLQNWMKILRRKKSKKLKYHENVVRKRSRVTFPKQQPKNIHAKKAMLCVFVKS